MFFTINASLTTELKLVKAKAGSKARLVEIKSPPLRLSEGFEVIAVNVGRQKKLPIVLTQVLLSSQGKSLYKHSFKSTIKHKYNIQ